MVLWDLKINENERRRGETREKREQGGDTSAQIPIQFE
jgi:hypothetical protein